RCAELVYRPPSQEERAGAAEIRRIVGKNFGQSIERPGEELFAFVRDLSEVRYLPARDPTAKAGGDEIDLSRGWSITAPGTLDAAALRLADYLRSAMNAEVEARPGEKNVRLEISPDL